MDESNEAASAPGPTVGEAGESAVLARVLAQLSAADAARVGPGDDCAVVAVDGDLVVTSDTMIEGTDFRLDWHTGYQLGWKLAATNLSDVAAMGATPTGLTVSLACRRDTQITLLEDIAAGVDAACRRLAPGCAVVGGDLATAPALFAGITALGNTSGRAPVLRSGASVGDVVAYAGDLGLSGLGLSLLRETSSAREIDALWVQHPGALTAHLTPMPPVTLGDAAQRAGATAMLDVSDSLSIDGHRIAIASGVTLDLDAALLEREFGSQHGETVSVASMLAGGEDHGLLATFPGDAVLPEGFRIIGSVRSADGPELTLNGDPYEPRGWDTFTGTT